MRRGLLALLILGAAFAGPAFAQRLPYEDVLAPAPAPHAHSPASSPQLGYGPAGPPAAGVPESALMSAFYGDRLEWDPEGDGFAWDVSMEMGTQAHRLWLATSGGATFGGPIEVFEAQALYSHPVTEAGLAFQLGVRRDFEPRPLRTYLTAGFQGNLNERLYVGTFGFLSTHGELIGRAFAWYDQPIGRRFVLQPAVETEIAPADIPALGIGRGPIFLEAGARLRWRIAEAFAPYVGFNWFRLVGRTADIARAAGDEVETANFVVGVRSYF